MRNKVTAWASWAEYRNSENLAIGIPRGGDLPTALFFPADYSIGMANLGYHYIYRRLRELGVAVERFFASPIPYRSVECETLLERFPVVMAGISYECDVPVFAKWLSGGGIPASREERNFDGAPIVGAGGAVTYINPLSLSGLADFIMLGDALPEMPHVIEVLRRGGTRESILQKLAECPSILVPEIHIDSKDRFCLKTSRGHDPSHCCGHGNWIAAKSLFGSTLLVELQRGCVRKCKFCTLPSCFGTPRQRDLKSVLDGIKHAASAAYFKQVGLVTPEAGDYRELKELLAELDNMNKGGSYASLRGDALVPEMVRALTRYGRHSLTIAPESGDDDLRMSCGKKFNNDSIVEVLEMARKEGVMNVKLYFMIGLPNEDRKSVLSISELCGRIRRETGLKLTVSVSPFIPKPGTEWSGFNFNEAGELRKKYRMIFNEVRNLAGTTLQSLSVRDASLEYTLSWASSGISKKFADAAASGGAVKNITDCLDKMEAMSELERLGLIQNETKRKVGHHNDVDKQKNSKL